MKIAVVGGGPGGLYFSILTKKAKPNWEIEVFERNKADDSFGFGVVFSDETLSEFLTRDPDSYELIRSHFAYWDDLDIVRDSQRVRITGNGFCGCSRKTLLQLLHQRCQDEGVKLHFESEQTNFSALQDAYHIVVAADGIGSKIREQLAPEFGTEVIMQRNRFVWMGSTRPLDAFTYWFKNTQHGAMVAHTYQYEEGMSTWIFECSPETFNNWGFDTYNEADTTAKLEQIFAEELDGHSLITNKSHWRQFPRVSNKKWFYNNIVLLGDAKATAHFSIGSGTKLAMESAIALSDAIVENSTPQEAFLSYEQNRRKTVERIQQAADVSLHWFETMDRHIKHPFYRFAFGVMTRSKKVSYENLRIRDKSFTDQVLDEFLSLEKSTTRSAAFSPFQLGKLRLSNRIIMSPMGQYKAQNGIVNHWHLVHYGGRATGGVGLIFTEMTAVTDSARITSRCAGIYTREQIKAWKEIVDFIHQHSSSKIGMQLGHAGRKCRLEGGYNLLSASAIAFSEEYPVPGEMNEQQMKEVELAFVQAAKNAEEAGFDMLELQAHHGFLLASFLSPLTNQRKDEYGGSIGNRLKFPIRVFKAIREAFPLEKPISVRISACDWAPGGISQEDVLATAKAFKEAGADIINVSTGNTVKNENIPRGRLWQSSFADMIRNELDIATITAGEITEIDQINTLLLNGNADLVALGKPLLINAGFVRDAQAYEGISPDDVPQPYNRAVSQWQKQKSYERLMLENMKKSLKPESHKK
ncbi:MAG: FAD-dependent monooxygenase [Luteibaculum sp.]